MLKVAQCWDDGVVNDLRLIELLRKYHAKATFNLNPGMIKEHTVPSEWIKFGYEGSNFMGFRSGRIGKSELLDTYRDFQVASHCWMHETAGKHPDDVFLKAALDARKFLEDLFQRECRGFAWPMGYGTPETAKLLKNAGFAYGRIVDNACPVTGCDNTMFLAPSCKFNDRNFFSCYKKAKATDGVFYFWGHSYEMLEYDALWEQFEQKLAYICNDPEVEWIDVIDIIPLCKERRLN